MSAGAVSALVVGAAGQLGSDLMRVLGEQGVTASGWTRAELDVADPAAVAPAVVGWAAGTGRGSRPVVFNAAAWTDVDGAETDEATAYAVNATAPGLLAAACAAAGADLVHVSTDYVFAGNADVPYPEDAPTEPLGAYGRTKAAGEQAVLGGAGHAYVVRTAWVYGAVGRNFVKTMARLEQERDTLEVVADQQGSPTWSGQLAAGLVGLATTRPPPGVYHCTNGGQTSWCGLARAVFEELGADPDRVQAVGSAAFRRPAPRPAYSVLASTRWASVGLPLLPDWRTALHDAFARSGEALRPGNGHPKAPPVEVEPSR
ncbi:MAG: dTDP-4-dehydrorhamnose reductase [Actinomycetota bacterium]|nr:dTDP-4-dehydrorhamnose reductase [Actinomycetota bacterium]